MSFMDSAKAAFDSVADYFDTPKATLNDSSLTWTTGSGAISGVKGIGSSGAQALNSTSQSWTSTVASAMPGWQVLASQDPFFRFPVLDQKDFNKIYNYEFVIWNTKTKKRYSIFLPMAPQSISVDAPAASTLTATMKGIVEDSNGSPLRRIAVVGTSGINWTPPMRATHQESALAKNLEYAFKNTIGAVKEAKSAFGKAVSAFSGGNDTPPKPAPLNRDTTDPIVTANTGYVFFHELARFFDFYLALKKNVGGKDYRLSFNMYKDKMYYDCILGGFSFTKPPGTTEYQYRINLTAYARRDDPKGERQVTQPNYLATQVDSLSQLAGITEGLKRSRLALCAANGVLTGIKGDIQDTLLTPLNQAVLLAKELADEKQTLLDFKDSIRNDTSFKSAFKSLSVQYKRLGGKALGDTQHLSSTQMAKALATTENSKKADGAPLELTSDIVDVIFSDPNKYAVLFDSVNVNDMPLSGEVKDQLSLITDKIKAMTVDDFIKNQESMVTAANSISIAFGGGDPTADALLNGAVSSSLIEYMAANPANADGTTNLTPENIEILSSINDAIMATSSLINLYKSLQPGPTNDYAEFYKEYAQANGIQYSDSSSKFYVPFPYGSTLEQLALQYLGSPSAWIEIAAINGLKAPYIDELGYFIPLLAAGAGHSVSIASADRLYVGQIIELSSDAVIAEMHKIKKIDQISAVQVILTLDGAADLAKFQIADLPQLHAYLPDTVNSSRMIAIPSTDQVNVPGYFRPSPNSPEDLGVIGRIAKVDFLLQSDGSMVFVGGDIKLAVGYQNLVQAAMLKLMTRRGSLVHDPSFGNPIFAGAAVADININALMDSMRSMFTEDSRFSGVQAARIALNGPAAVMEILVGVSGSDVHLPLSVELPK